MSSLLNGNHLSSQPFKISLLKHSIRLIGISQLSTQEENSFLLDTLSATTKLLALFPHCMEFALSQTERNALSTKNERYCKASFYASKLARALDPPPFFQRFLLLHKNYEHRKKLSTAVETPLSMGRIDLLHEFPVIVKNMNLKGILNVPH